MSVADEDDIKSWIREGKMIANSLKKEGIMHAEKQIVELCNTYYWSQLDRSNSFQNIYQVLDLIKDKTFASGKYDLFLNMLHMFQYGIFRCAFNAWAVDAANKWMCERNLKYKDEITNSDGSLSRKGKGFAYRLLVSRASNTICVRFQNLTQRYYREYIIVRDRKKESLLSENNVIHYTFNHNYRGYIVRCKNRPKLDEYLLLSCSEKTTITNLVCKAMKNGRSFESITELLQSYGKTTNNGTFFLLLMIDKSSSVTIIKLIQHIICSKIRHFDTRSGNCHTTG